MLSEEQMIKKRINVLKTAKLFIEEDCFIKDIADKLNLTTSSVQRYLNDPIIKEEFGDETAVFIKNKLLKNKESGNLNGGLQFVKKNNALKDKNGKFIGSQPKLARKKS